jgi:hypothetical protein
MPIVTSFKVTRRNLSFRLNTVTNYQNSDFVWSSRTSQTVKNRVKPTLSF